VTEPLLYCYTTSLINQSSRKFKYNVVAVDLSQNMEKTRESGNTHEGNESSPGKKELFFFGCC